MPPKVHISGDRRWKAAPNLLAVTGNKNEEAVMKMGRHRGELKRGRVEVARGKLEKSMACWLLPVLESGGRAVYKCCSPAGHSFSNRVCHQNTGVLKTTTKSNPKWGRKRLTSSLKSLDTEILASLPLAILSTNAVGSTIEKNHWKFWEGACWDGKGLLQGCLGLG